MTINEIIKELEQARERFGDIPVQLQDSPQPDEIVTSYEDVFVIPEQYKEGWICNIRWWPY